MTDLGLSRFLETFRVCGTFLYGYADRELEYFLFERFDDRVIIDLSEDALNDLLQKELIPEDLKNLCAEFREISISVLENKTYEYTAAFVRNSYAWRHILKFADYLKERICGIDKDYELSPLRFKEA